MESLNPMTTFKTLKIIIYYCRKYGEAGKLLLDVDWGVW